MAFLRTEGIVIKATNLREADKIITFFSKEYGKIQGVAKGIRKITSKYSGKLELFNRVQVIFFQKIEPFQGSEQHPLLRITQVDMVEAFPQLQSEFNKIVGASYIAEFLNTLFENYDATHPVVYGLVCETLRTIATTDQIRNILPAFEIKLLGHLGYTPVLDRCTECGNELKGEKFEVKGEKGNRIGFSSVTGGVLCQRCQAFKKGSLPITEQSVEILKQFLAVSMSKAPLLAVSHEQYREIKTLLMQHYQYHLGLDLKTEKFVQKLRTAQLAL